MDSGLSHCRGVAFLLAAGFSFSGCGGGGATSVPPPPPPPPSIIVKVTPATGTVLLGNAQAFLAEVLNTTNTNVTWSVNGIPGGNSSVGVISGAGIYTAPTDMPGNVSVQVTATSVADPTKSDSAQLILANDISIALAPGTTNVELGAVQKLQATLTSSSHPDTTIQWSLTGTACPTACGSLDASGNYTAPQVLPASQAVVVRAQSAADPAKFATANLNITSSFSLQINGPSSLSTNDSVTIVATLTPNPGSNPSQNLSWSLAGSGCSGSLCGTLATTTQFDANNIEVSSANYAAPGSAPNPNAVTITVTPAADPGKKAQLTIAIQPGPGVNLTPQTATAAINHRVPLTAQVTGTSNTSVNWSVNGIAGGSASVGQICAPGSNPCQVVASNGALQVDYLAPAAAPSPNPVTVVAQSVANPSAQAASQITVINHVLVSVQPANVALAPLAAQGFTASVLGTNNQSVTWQVQGDGCAASGACGTISAIGTYAAPSAAPVPNAIRVIAISADDTSQFGTANVSISAGPNILTLHPASVYAGEVNGFTLRVDGSGFIAGSGSGSVLLIGGTARTTTCPTTNECTAAVASSDTQTAGNVSVQVKNPDGSLSNAVAIVVLPLNASTDTITLTAGSPGATGEDIVVVEPTTAGVSVQGSDVDLDVAALGEFDITANSCNLGGNPIPLVRPQSGASAVDICLFSQSGLDASMTFSISGPGDIAILAKQPAGLGIIHLTLQVQANAQAGARTLFIQNTNLDKTAASGVLEVQ